MNWYRIDYKRLVLLLLPTTLRRSRLTALLNAAVAPLSRLYVRFMGFRDDTRYRVEHNAQVCHLQAVLNDAFDYVDRRVYITDAQQQEIGQFLWREAEDRPILLGVFLLNRERFMGADAIDFIVRLPADLQLTPDNQNMLHSLLRYYKLAGKRYVVMNEE
jgi:hypothetical protein